MNRPRALDVVASMTAAFVASAPKALAEGAVARPGDPAPPSRMRSIGAVRRVGPLVLDGRLDEAAWAAAPWGDGFTQAEPDEGAPASVQTRFKVLWDDKALYVGVECDDPEPPTARLSRRDRAIDADYISFDLDTTLDRRTAYHFQIFAAGQQRDGIHFNDTEFTSDWDGAWESSVAATDRGWSLEAKIPLRLLRIRDGTRAFGFNLYRYLARRHEEDQWRYRPRGTPGDISQLGLLQGLDGIRPVRSLELRPYLAARTTLTTPAPANVRAPAAFAGCGSVGANPNVVAAGCAGLDLRYSLASDLSLIATVNPDFGQVEADARVLNLSTFETFFPEKRPFFLEDLDLFKSPLQIPFGGPYGGQSFTLFYSRRIGRPPEDPDTSDGATILYQPSAQPVAAAVKLTGSVGRASVGFLSAVQPKVFSQVLQNGTVQDRLSATAAYDGALRLRTPLGDNSIAGFTATAADPLFTGSGRRAHVGAADFTAFSSSRTYSLSAQLAGSLLSGGPHTVVRDGTVIDPGATGVGFTSIARKNGEGFDGAVAADYLSPRFSTNDLGFMPRANLARAMAYVGYNDPHPAGWRQRWNMNVAAREVRDAALGVTLHRAIGPEFSLLFRNYWGISAGVSREGRAADDRELRDGTPLERQPAWVTYGSVGSDSRRPVSLDLSWSQRREEGRAAINTELDWSLGFRPHPQFEGSLDGAVIYETGTVRRIRKATALPGGTEDPTVVLDPEAAVLRTREYLLAPLRARSVSATLRCTLAFSPRLTLQSYAQLFTAGLAYGGAQRAVVGPGKRLVTLGQLTDATAADAPPNADNRQVGLNLNLILRWEWMLGSTLYLVYAHQTSNEIRPSVRGLSFSGDLAALSSAQGAVSGDTILVKVDLLKAL
jgi:hypothetical protein